MRRVLGRGGGALPVREGLWLRQPDLGRRGQAKKSKFPPENRFLGRKFHSCWVGAGGREELCSSNPYPSEIQGTHLGVTVLRSAIPDHPFFESNSRLLNQTNSFLKTFQEGSLQHISTFAKHVFEAFADSFQVFRLLLASPISAINLSIRQAKRKKDGGNLQLNFI